MRLKEYYAHPRLITYYGVNYIIPYGYTHIATDSQGYVCVYRSAPRRMKNASRPHWQGSDKHYVGVVDFEGEDWLATLVKLDEETNAHRSPPEDTNLT